MSMSKQRLPIFLILLFLLLGLGALNLYWLKLDTRPHAYTDGYVEKTMNLADGLWWSGPCSWSHSLLIAVRAGGDHPSADGIHQIDLMNLGWRERWDVAFLLDVIEYLPDDVGVQPGRA